MAVASFLSLADIVEGSCLPTEVCSDDVNIIYGDHRLLVVRISPLRFRAVCCSAHGKDYDHGRASIEGYWGDAYTRVAARLKKGDRLICGTDANCRIGRRSGNDDAIVAPVLDAFCWHNFISDAFIESSRKLQLAITVTHPEYIDGDGRGGSLHTSL